MNFYRSQKLASLFYLIIPPNRQSLTFWFC